MRNVQSSGQIISDTGQVCCSAIQHSTVGYNNTKCGLGHNYFKRDDPIRVRLFNILVHSILDIKRNDKRYLTQGKTLTVQDIRFKL